MTRKDGGVVERAALEMQCTGDCTGGSNPPLSASNTQSQKERLKLKRLRPFSFLKRFLNDSEYIEGYIIVPRETGTNYRRNISQIKNYGTLKRTETRLHDETNHTWCLSVVIPIVILCVGLIYPPHIVAAAMIVIEIIVSLLLICENRQLSRKPTL